MTNMDKIKNYDTCIDFIKTLRLAFFCETHQITKKVKKGCFKCVMWTDIGNFLKSLKPEVCEVCKGTLRVWETKPVEGVGYSGSFSCTYPCPKCIGVVSIQC